MENSGWFPVFTFFAGSTVPYFAKMIANYKDNKTLRAHYLDTLNSVLPEIDGKVKGLKTMIDELGKLSELGTPILEYQVPTHTIINSFNHQKVYELFANHTEYTDDKQKLLIIKIQKVMIFITEFDAKIYTQYREMTEAIRSTYQKWDIARENFHKVKSQLIEAGSDFRKDEVLVGINQMYNKWSEEDTSRLAVSLSFFSELEDYMYPHYNKGGRNDLLPLIDACQDFAVLKIKFDHLINEYHNMFQFYLEGLTSSTDGFKKLIEKLEKTRLKPWYRMPFNQLAL